MITSLRYEEALSLIDKTTTKEEITTYMKEIQNLISELKSQLACDNIAVNAKEKPLDMKWRLSITTKMKYSKRLSNILQMKLGEIKKEKQKQAIDFNYNFVQAAKDILPENLFNEIKEKALAVIP